MAEDTPNAATPPAGGETQTVDWQNDPEFHQLPLGEKHKVLMSVDPDYAQLPAPERSKALNAIHYGQGAAAGTGKEFTDERNPDNQESGGSHVLTTLGHQVKNAALAASRPYTGALETFRNARGQGDDLLPAVGKAGARAMYEAAPGGRAMLDAVGTAANAPQEYKNRRESGYSPVYSALAPTAAGNTGVDLESIEHYADVGDTKGVLSEAAVPVGEMAGMELGRAAMHPDAVGGKWLENRRQTHGPANIIEGLDTPGGKKGARAEKMSADVEAAKGDLADIQRESPIKGKNAESHRQLVDKIEERRDKLWDEGHKPGIDRHKEAPINHQALVDAANAQLTPEAGDAAPGEEAAARKWIDEKINKPRTLDSADKLIREINGDLNHPGAINRYGPLQVRAKQAVVKALRSEVDRVLQDSGEQGVKDVNRRWGALGNVQDRMAERAVQLARSEAKGGVLPDWVHTYAFLHPGQGVAVGVGVRAAETLKGSPESSLRKGMRQLGKSNLSAPVGDVPPPGWRPGEQSDFDHRLPAPAPEPTPLQQPGQNESGTVNDPQARWANPRGLLKSPVRGLLPPPRTEGNLPGTAEVMHPEMFQQHPIAVEPQTNVQRGPGGRMQKVQTGMGQQEPVGHTAEGGDIMPAEPPKPQRAARPTERRQEMNMARVSPTGEERRAYPAAERQGKGTREALMKAAQGVLDDTQATAKDKAKAKTELADLKKGARKAGRDEAREKGVKGGTDNVKELTAGHNLKKGSIDIDAKESMYSGPDRRMGDDTGVGPHGVERRSAYQMGLRLDEVTRQKREWTAKLKSATTDSERELAQSHLDNIEAGGAGNFDEMKKQIAEGRKEPGKTSRLTESQAQDRIQADPKLKKKWDALDPNVKSDKKIRDTMLVDEQNKHLEKLQGKK